MTSPHPALPESKPCAFAAILLSQIHRHSQNPGFAREDRAGLQPPGSVWGKASTRLGQLAGRVRHDAAANKTEVRINRIIRRMLLPAHETHLSRLPPDMRTRARRKFQAL